MATETFEQTTLSTDSTTTIVRRFSHHVIAEHAEEQLAVALATQETKDEENEEKARALEHQWMSLFIPGAKQHFEYESQQRIENCFY
jgi:4-hydroxy-3-methylbut-2-enyl diphosphate reductase IspH